MGNQQLVRILSDIGVTDISQREVTFQEGLLHAKAIFQRHNYQLYQVHCPEPNNPLGFVPDFNLTLRVIRCLNDPESIAILKEMQEKVVSLPPHQNLIRFYIMAIIAENHNEKQKAGLIGLPGLYKSVQGTTDYKNDTIQFFLVEEDHLSILPASFFADQQLQGPELLRRKLTLKQFMDRVLPNPLLIEFFSTDETIIYQLIVQSLTALAFLNEQGMSHQDLMPHNIIFELISPQMDQPGNFTQINQNLSNEFTQKFKVKLGEYLKIKMLSDIAFQKTLLIQMQQQLLTNMNIEQQTNMINDNTQGQKQSPQEQVQKMVQQLKDNKNLYSQYDPPEKLEQESIQVSLKKGRKYASSFEDYDITLKPIKLQNQNCDIWSLGIIILEVYLSLYIHKRDCKDMVHNLYLNKLSYQSRCILINEILDNKKNPIICSLIKEMLRDSQGTQNTAANSPEDTKIIDEKTMYDELILNTQNFELARPTALQLLSKNRIIHYFAYISDNQIEDRYLPRDINLLQVFITNEMFVPMLIKCGMQNVLNKKKSIICFFSLMTLYIKNGLDDAQSASQYYNYNPNQMERSKIQQFILDSLIDSKAYVQLIELMNYCLSSDLRQVMLFFNQNLMDQNDILNLEIDDLIFKNDFLEQKQAGLECYLSMLRMQEQSNNLFTFMQESMNAGLVSLSILLTQMIKNQKWMRQKCFSSIQLSETSDPLTQHTLDLIEKVCQYGHTGLSQTMGRFLDKVGFFEHLIETLFKEAKQEDEERKEEAEAEAARIKALSGQQSSRQGENRQPARNRRFSQKRLTNAESVANDRLNLDPDLSLATSNKNATRRNNAKAMGHASASRQMHKKHNQTVNIDDIDLSSQESAARKARTARAQQNDSVNMSAQQKLNTFKKVFRERLIDFIEKCLIILSESTVKQIMNLMDNQTDYARLIQLLSGEQFTKYVKTSTIEFKNYLVEFMMKNFQQLYLQTGRAGAQSVATSSKAATTHRLKAEKETFGTLNSYRQDTKKNDGVDSARNKSLNQKSQTTQQEYKKSKENKEPKSSASRNRIREQTGAASVGQSDFLNQTYTSLKSQVRREADPSTKSRNPKSKAQGPMTEQERQLCDLSRVLQSVLDDEADVNFLFAIKYCIQQQMCLSSEFFIQQAKLEKFQPPKEDELLATIQKQPGQHRRPCTTFSPNTKRKSQHMPHTDSYTQLNKTNVKRDPTKRHGGGPQTSKHVERRSSTQHEIAHHLEVDRLHHIDNHSVYTANVGVAVDKRERDIFESVPSHLLQMLAQYFFRCESCENQTYCIVCAVKFHQDHKNIRPACLSSIQDMFHGDSELKGAFCHTAHIQRYLNSEQYQSQEMMQLKKQLSFIDQTFFWCYEPDVFTSMQIQNTLKQNIQKKAPQGQGQSTLNQNYQIAQFTQKAIMNFDIFDSQAIVVEGETHFINGESDQVHALISSSPLEVVDQMQLKCTNFKNPKEVFDCYKQSYFEIKIHSGGFYDQVQIGLLFMHEKDVMNGFASSSDVIQALKNLSMIPGYEPLSIGYHGDDGHIYNNLCQDISIENLIKRAQIDCDKLLEEAETDSSLFEINSSQVYGGIYGPPFASGDHVGCGIVPIDLTGGLAKTSKANGYAIYFTRNGVQLPAVKLQCTGMKLFPVVSLKGKLCHIEVLQDIERYAFNVHRAWPSDNQLIVSSMLANEKFMRSLTQFNHALMLKGRRMSFTATVINPSKPQQSQLGVTEPMWEKDLSEAVARTHGRGGLHHSMSYRDNYSERSKSRTRHEHSQHVQQRAQRFAPDNLLKYLRARDGQKKSNQNTSNAKATLRENKSSQKHQSTQKPRHDQNLRNKNFQSFQKQGQSKKKLLPPSATGVFAGAGQFQLPQTPNNMRQKHHGSGGQSYQQSLRNVQSLSKLVKGQGASAHGQNQLPFQKQAMNRAQGLTGSSSNIHQQNAPATHFTGVRQLAGSQSFTGMQMPRTANAGQQRQGHLQVPGQGNSLAFSSYGSQGRLQLPGASQHQQQFTAQPKTPGAGQRIGKGGSNKFSAAPVSNSNTTQRYGHQRY